MRMHHLPNPLLDIAGNTKTKIFETRLVFLDITIAVGQIWQRPVAG